MASLIIIILAEKKKKNSSSFFFKFFYCPLELLLQNVFCAIIKIITTGRDFRDHLVQPIIFCPEKVNGAQNHTQ